MSVLELARRAAVQYQATQFPEELAAFAGLLPDLHRILEIGTQNGGSLWYWGKLALPDAQIVSVDVDQSQADALNPRGVRLEGDSTQAETALAVRELFDGPLDLLFIDGDHSYESVRSDWETYSPLVGLNGVVGFHDIHSREGWPAGDGVARVWAEVGSHTKLEIGLQPPGWGIGAVLFL